MPRYFFNVHKGLDETVDIEGAQLPDEQTAVREALQVLVDLIRDELPPRGDEIGIHFDQPLARPGRVVNEQGGRNLARGSSGAVCAGRRCLAWRGDRDARPAPAWQGHND